MADRIWSDAEDDREYERMCEIEERWDTAPAVLAAIGGAPGASALHVNVQGSSWLPALSRWAGREGGVAVAALSDDLETIDWVPAATAATVRRFGLDNVVHLSDEEAETHEGFDLVVCYRVLYGVGKEEGDRVLNRALRCVRPGGWFCVVEFDYRTWRFAPSSEPLERLNSLIQRYAEPAYEMDFTAGRLPGLFRDRGLALRMHADCAALQPGTLLQDKPYTAAAAGSGISDPVRDALGGDIVDGIRSRAERDAFDPGRWTLSPAIVTAFARTAARPAGGE